MNRRRLVAELIGTFVLVFAGTGAIVVNEVSGGEITHPGIALSFGLAVLVMIYSIGPISGAHMNPAVTVGFAVARRFEPREVLPYIVVQCVGAILASLVLLLLFGDVGELGATVPRGAVMVSFCLEVILTAVLMFVILCVATGSKEQGLMAGIAIGGTVAMEALFAGPISGASMNPARSIAPALCTGRLEHAWIYLVAPLAGALLGAISWRATVPDSQLTSVDRREKI